MSEDSRIEFRAQWLIQLAGQFRAGLISKGWLPGACNCSGDFLQTVNRKNCRSAACLHSLFFVKRFFLINFFFFGMHPNLGFRAERICRLHARCTKTQIMMSYQVFSAVWDSFEYLRSSGWTTPFCEPRPPAEASNRR